MTPKGFSILHLLLLVFVFALAGCSGSGESPITPDPVGDVPDITAQTGTDNQDNETGGACRMVWGFYDIAYDSESGEMEIVPLRQAEYTFNVTMFLQPPAGDPTNLGLTIIDASQFTTNGNIDLDISITHPFPGAPKLTGFDVMGVFMGDGAIASYQDPSVIYPATGGIDAILRNSDGYTRWMNATEFTQTGLLGFTQGSKGIPGFAPTSTINGYKYFSESLSATDDLPTYFQTAANITNRGSFQAGSTLSRRYEIKFPLSPTGPMIRFQYAILASWAASDPGSWPSPGVSDFPPPANLQEAIHVAVTDNGSNLYYVDATDFGGDLKLQIEIFDWQGAANPAGIPGEISHIWIEDSGGLVIPGGFTDVLPGATVSAGCGNSSVFTVDITGCTPQGAGRQEFLIAVESALPTNYDNGFGSPFPASAPLSAFNRFNINIGNTNPCPTPTVTSLQQPIVNVNDVMPGFGFNGTNFQSGTQLIAALYKTSGNIIGTNVQVNTSTTAQADFDFSAVSAGMYDFYFMNGCGVPATLLTGALEVNTPPTSTGITGPATGDGNYGVATYNANASDSDTDPIDVLTYSWTVTETLSGTTVIGPTPGDPFGFDFSTIAVGKYDVDCVVSDSYVPADLNLNYPITRTNTQPIIGTPSGITPVWFNLDTFTYNVVASDIDPGQTLTYTWSFEPKGNPPNYTIPGDPIPGDVTINFSSVCTSTGNWNLACRVDDGSGAGNATADSPVFAIYVADDPYVSPIPPGMFNQVVVPGMPSLQGVAGCPFFWDSFYGPNGGWPFSHPDISILSGPSLGMAGVMVLADEVGALVGPLGLGIMGFAHYTCPYTSGAIPSWTWLTTGQWPAPGCPDMIPSVIHFDGNSQGELFVSNSQMTGKLGVFAVPDPSAFSHYLVGGPYLNDLYTSLPSVQMPDVAVDTTAGFDMGNPGTPMSAPLYGLYTQDQSSILNLCGGPLMGPLAPNPVNFLEFPSGGAQPVGTPVDAAGSVGVVAPLPALMVGAGPGLFNVAPGGPCPAVALQFPEPYYAIAVDDDPMDNEIPSQLPQPVSRWVITATIDAERDVEIYEMDFGVAPPGPAPIAHLCTIPMGTFMGGCPTAYPLDCEFISNFSNFSGTPKPVWFEDLLAVLVTEPAGGIWFVEIYSLAGGVPTFISMTMPVPTPPGMMFPVGGIAYRLDVDEVTGDIYVVHEDTVGTGSLTVTIIPY